MKNNLPVSKGHVQSTFHRCEIIAAFRRLEGCASEFAIQNFDSVFRFHHFQEFLEIISGDLVSESATAAVKHHHDLVRDSDSKFFRELFVAHVLWPRDLHFQIMVAAAEGTDLVVPSIDCTLADFRGVGACDATVLLGNFKVVLPAIAALNTPARRARPGREIPDATI